MPGFNPNSQSFPGSTNFLLPSDSRLYDTRKEETLIKHQTRKKTQEGAFTGWMPINTHLTPVYACIKRPPTGRKVGTDYRATAASLYQNYYTHTYTQCILLFMHLLIHNQLYKKMQESRDIRLWLAALVNYIIISLANQIS